MLKRCFRNDPDRIILPSWTLVGDHVIASFVIGALLDGLKQEANLTLESQKSSATIDK